jgi:hypothetical protein
MTEKRKKAEKDETPAEPVEVSADDLAPDHDEDGDHVFADEFDGVTVTNPDDVPPDEVDQKEVQDQ